MQGVAYPNSGSDQVTVAEARRQRESTLKGKGMRKMLADVQMNEREVDHAIKITEERLGVLKNAVKEKKGLTPEARESSESPGSST